MRKQLASKTSRTQAGPCPRCPDEAALCRRRQQALRALAAGHGVRRNYPYTGRSDGLTAWLRRRFPARHDLGIEL